MATLDATTRARVQCCLTTIILHYVKLMFGKYKRGVDTCMYF